jgi:hypothetical protein
VLFRALFTCSASAAISHPALPQMKLDFDALQQKQQQQLHQVQSELAAAAAAADDATRQHREEVLQLQKQLHDAGM